LQIYFCGASAYDLQMKILAGLGTELRLRIVFFIAKFASVRFGSPRMLQEPF